MQILSTLSALAQWRDSLNTTQSLGFVPTMGNLHDGHLQLVARAKQACDKVVVSIFVNPLQFGANEDLARYPRTFDADCEKLQQAGVDALFFPSVDDIYPKGMAAQTYVEVPVISERFCGEFRPGHFRGVATVVCKLFNLVRPHSAFFGEKDFQQLLVIKTMVADLAMGIRIVPVETQREPSGLAMSSRNGYLSDGEKQQAAALYACLTQCQSRIVAGERAFRTLESEYSKLLTHQGLVPDYFSICHADTLELAQPSDASLVLLVAAYLGNTRLIDNISFSLQG